MWKKLSAWMASGTEKLRQQLYFIKEVKWWVWPVSALLGAFVGFFFYRDWIFCLIGAAVGVILVPQELQKMIYRKEKSAKIKEFVLFLEKTTLALSAGKSLENAFLEFDFKQESARREFALTHGHMEKLQRDLKAGQKVEMAFLTYSLDIKIMGAMQLAQVIIVARQSGGNLPQIFRDSMRVVKERAEVEEALHLQLLQQQLEHKVLFVMPFVVLAMLMWMSPSYVALLYETTMGRLVMTGALILMAISYVISEKISKIQV